MLASPFAPVSLSIGPQSMGLGISVVELGISPTYHQFTTIADIHIPVD
jgi:hypothetical protein